MKQYFAYTRVSTARQGEHGVSLQEQRSEIERYARQKDLAISEWFEERVTAAKLGRTIFGGMIKRLRRGDAAGVIIHKIDRSARNLRDWVDIAQLTDDGIEVHFTREALDLQSASGRLSADVQAVVAANYVRNLREETIKGFYGRLKQGLYPMAAPIGYLDCGAGKPKAVDPERGRLIRMAFELYASQEHSQESLTQEMNRLGLRTKSGLPVSKNTLAGVLSNSFYYGVIQIQKNNQSFAGIHQPLISRQLFDTVQDVLHGRSVRSKAAHREYLFSRLIRCEGCNRSLVAETKKKHVYYRCHSHSCRGTSFREERILGEIESLLTKLRSAPEEAEELADYIEERRAGDGIDQRRLIAEAEVRLAAVNDRMNRLTDALIDGHVESHYFDARRKALIAERAELNSRLQDLRNNENLLSEELQEYVELVKSAYLLFKQGDQSEKRQLLRFAMSNRSARHKTLSFSLKPALSSVALHTTDRSGAPPSPRRRTFWKEWVESLMGSQASHRTRSARAA